MARFEAALASARAGVLPVEDAEVIARVSDARHHRELTKIFAKPATGQRLTNIELKIVATTSEEFAEHIGSEMPLRQGDPRHWGEDELTRWRIA